MAWPRRALVIFASTCVVACTACIDWLEVDDGSDEPILDLPVGRPMVLPSTPPEAGGRGPIVPATPGLRVPLAGYWTRARLDAADLLLPYTWVSFMEGTGQVILRLEGATSVTDEPLAATQSLRVILPITLPPGTDSSALAGLELAGPALKQATVALRTSPNDLWIVELSRLSLDVVRTEVVVGTLEGQARRGAAGQRERRFEAGFIALRAPDPEALPPDPAVPEGGPGAFPGVLPANP